jgi:hypothetical protein
MRSQDLVRNGLRVEENPVIYAHDLAEKNSMLRELFPKRSLYVYQDGELTALP